MKLTSFVSALLMVMGLTACNTMQGIGEDMSAAGDAIDRKAEEKKGY